MAVINEYNMTKIYTAVVLSLFDNIQLARRDVTPYTVPIVFGEKSELYKRLYAEATKDPSVTHGLQMPAMSLSFNGMERNFDRQTNRLLKKRLLEIDGLTTQVNWNDVAVDLSFTLTLVSKSMTEMTNIAEYIMSVFKNGLYYVDVTTPLYSEAISTPIKLNTTSVEIDNNAEVYENMRTMETSFDIVVKGLLHNNLTAVNTKITKAMLNMYMDLQFQTLLASYQVDTRV